MAHKLSKIPKLGDVVLCDGEFCVILGFGGVKDSTSRSLKEVGVYENAMQIAFEGPIRRHKCAKFERHADGEIAEVIRWDPEIEKFYLWGRALSFEQKQDVIKMRDDGILPARKTRRRGMAPAGGEHMNLWKSLFQIPGPITGEKIGDYEDRFQHALTEGYAEPDLDDSFVEEVTHG